MDAAGQLLREIYSCRKCADLKFADRFKKMPSGEFYRFPPLIGTSERVKLLFVGCNPRYTRNTAIHEFAMRDFDSFVQLSNNVDQHGQEYIGAPGLDHESHYDLHNRIVQAVFGKPFGAVAAVTEMFLCASPNSTGLNCAKSPCAETYLTRTLAVADPDYIVTLGVGAWRYFRDHVRGIRSRVFHLPFPGNWTPATITQAAEDWAIAGIRALENNHDPPQAAWEYLDLPDMVKTYR